MAITIGDGQITSTSGLLGIGKSDPATALDINGTITATTFTGSASGLTGITEGESYYWVDNWDAFINNNTRIARTRSSVPAGHYIIYFAAHWDEQGGDEDWAQFEITAGTGSTVRSLQPRNPEANINAGDGQAGLGGMHGMADVILTQTADINLYFLNWSGDTDGGGFYGHLSWIGWQN